MLKAGKKEVEGRRRFLRKQPGKTPKFVKVFIEAKGMKVETTINGKAMLERFASSPPRGQDECPLGETRRLRSDASRGYLSAAEK